MNQRQVYCSVQPCCCCWHVLQTGFLCQDHCSPSENNPEAAGLELTDEPGTNRQVQGIDDERQVELCAGGHQVEWLTHFPADLKVNKITGLPIQTLYR